MLHCPRMAIFLYIYIVWTRLPCMCTMRSNFTSKNSRVVTCTWWLNNKIICLEIALVERLLKLSFMRLEDLYRNMRWNKPFNFHNFVDLVYVPCNNYLVHMSLKCPYKYNMKRSLVKNSSTIINLLLPNIKVKICL